MATPALYATQSTVVGQLFATTWAAAYPSVPVYGPNVEHEAPELGDDLATPRSFVAWQLEYDNAGQASFGGTRRVEGRVVIGLWAEKRAGRATLVAYLDAVLSMFTGGDGSGLFFLDPVPSPCEEREGWYVRPVEVPFIQFGEST